MRAAAVGVVCVIAASVAPAGATEPFDRSHAAWSELLARHVHWNDAGTATTVDYAGFARDRAPLDAYRAALATVSAADFAGWPAPARLAFPSELGAGDAVRARMTAGGVTVTYLAYDWRLNDAHAAQ